MTINVKISSDRKLNIKNRRFGGIQGDIGSVDIDFDISDVATKNQLWRVEFKGCAGTFESTVPLTPSKNHISVTVPKSVCDVGGTAQVYLIEELVADDKVTKRVCSYPLRLYFYNKPNKNVDLSVAEYERNMTDMYLYVASKASEIEEFKANIESRVGAVEETANELNDRYAYCSKAVAENSSAISKNKSDIAENKTQITTNVGRLDGHDYHISRLQNVPSNINCWVDWVSTGAPFIRITFDLLQGRQHYNNLTFEPTEASDNWQVLYLMFMSEGKYELTLSSGGEFFTNVAVCEFKYNGDTITEFVPYGCENLFENYISPMKADIKTNADNIADKENKLIASSGIYIQEQTIEGKKRTIVQMWPPDKTKLDGIEAGANKTVVDTELSADSNNPISNKAVYEAIQSAIGDVIGGAS